VVVLGLFSRLARAVEAAESWAVDGAEVVAGGGFGD
jgi:hypothetical protein